MKIAILSVCVLGCALAVGLKAQTTVPPHEFVRIDTTAPTALLKYGTLEVGHDRVVAKNVEIQMGDNVLVADEAQIRYGVGGSDVVELRGTVRLKALKLRVN